MQAKGIQLPENSLYSIIYNNLQRAEEAIQLFMLMS